MQIKTILTSSPLLKVTSLILGFMLWKVLSESSTISAWVEVPVCFYNGKHEDFDAPTSIMVELKGKRFQLRQLKDLAVHIDAQKVAPGPNGILVNQELMLLPPTIFVGDTIPHNLIIRKVAA